MVGTPQRLTLAALALGTWWGCSLTFPCSSDADCARDGAAGVCQASGYCSFPDSGCESDQRYGELAPPELAGTCVPAGDTTTGATDDTAGPGTTGTSMVTPTTQTATATETDPDTTVGVVDGSSTDGGSFDSSGDTGEPQCCYSGCEETCDGICSPEQQGAAADMQEAIGVAVIGDWVVWSTGFGRRLMITDVVTDTHEELAQIEQNSFVTKIAADDTHVYFVDWGGETVRRISVPEGAVDLVTEVPGGQARFGGITVGSEHVYFAMRGTGGIWRAAKDLSDQRSADLFADAASPFDVVLDQDYVYWINNEEEQVFRKPQVSDEAPEVVYDGASLSTLAVDGTHVFIGDSGNIIKVDKNGKNEGIVVLSADHGNIWDVGVDDNDVYWTSSTDGAVWRVSKDGDGAEQLADTLNPWGLDLGCTSIYWAENGTQTLQAQLK